MGLLSGKTAIVTGASKGIGREIALALANEGVKILANDIGVSLSGEGGSIQPAEETCGLITQKGGEALPDTNSVTSWSSASKIIENLSGDKLNESSIKATVEDISKNNIGKYL